MAKSLLGEATELVVEVHGGRLLSLPDLKGSSCMEVASVGVGDKRETDR